LFLRDNTDVAIQLENAVLNEVGLTDSKDKKKEKEDKVIDE